MMWVSGLGLWAPGLAGLVAYRDGVRDDEVQMPACAIATARSKRGTSRVARMLSEVAHQAIVDAGQDASSVATVFASAWGEIDIMITLLGQIDDGDVGLSPLRFKHSVHNTASGLLSIATENRQFSTAIAGGARTFEVGLLEAAALLATGTSAVCLVVGEDRLPEPLDRFAQHEGLALGMLLTRERPESSPRAPMHLSLPKRDATVAVAVAPAPWKQNPTAAGLELFDHALHGREGRVAISTEAPPMVVDVTLEPPRDKDRP